MGRNFEAIRITRRCELSDPDLEREFFSQDTKKYIRFIKSAVLLMGLVFFLFLIPDFFFVKENKQFLLILLSRMLFLALVYSLYWALDKIRDYSVLATLFSVFELISAAFFLFIFYLYGTPDFIIQSLGVMIILLSMCILPNKWTNNLAVSILIGAGFLVCSALLVRGIEATTFLAVGVYIILLIALCNLFLYTTNYNKRSLFLKNKKLEELAFRDSMTGLYSKNKFNAEIKLWMSYSKRYNMPLSLAILDLDDFKQINDRYGHLSGDQIIVEASVVMKSAIRASDILARWGGDEFVLLMPHTDIVGARKLIDRLHQKMRNNTYHGMNITCSFGIAQMTPEDNEVSIINRADSMLYSAKDSGKDRVVC